MFSSAINSRPGSFTWAKKHITYLSTLLYILSNEIIWLLGCVAYWSETHPTCFNGLISKIVKCNHFVSESNCWLLACINILQMKIACSTIWHFDVHNVRCPDVPVLLGLFIRVFLRLTISNLVVYHYIIHYSWNCVSVHTIQQLSSPQTTKPKYPHKCVATRKPVYRRFEIKAHRLFTIP